MLTLSTPDPSITIADLTQATLDGTGIFDTLMRSFKAHLDEQYQLNRIRGPEYTQVYLGGLQQVMQTALSFTMAQQKTNLENQVLEQQVLVAKAQVRKAEEDIKQTIAQTALITQQKVNLEDELLTQAKQRDKLVQEIANLTEQKQLIAQQRTNLIDELLTTAKQRSKLDQEVANLAAQLPLIQAQIVEMQNRATLVAAQIRKIDAEIQTETITRGRIDAERMLIDAKKFTEMAQTQGGASADSPIGAQVSLHMQQVESFKRDAEQKAASILVESWKVRRTTDEATVADGVNGLLDSNVGRAVNHMMATAGIPL